MQDLPLIPLWYNGILGADDEPELEELAAGSHRPPVRAVMWRGYLQMTGIDMITHVAKP